MAQVAFYTFGVLSEQRGHPRVQGFIDLIPEVHAAIDASPGYVTRRQGDRPDDLGPRFVDQARDPRAAQTLSIWRDLESVFTFAYRSGPHVQALRDRKDWFVAPPSWPTYVAWWVTDGELPTWEEAIRRLEHLHDHGPTTYAFDFKTPFDAQRNPTTVDRSRFWHPTAGAPLPAAD